MTKTKIAYLAVSQSGFRVPLYNLFAKDRSFDFRIFYDMEKTIGNPDWKVDKSSEFNYKVCKSIALWYPSKRHGKWERACFVLSSVKLVKELLWYKPDVIITVEHSIRTLYAVLVKLLSGCKVIVKFDGTVYTEGRISIGKLWLRKVVSKFIDSYCVLSDSGKEWLSTTLDVDERKIFKTPFVCDVGRFMDLSQRQREGLRRRFELSGKLVFVSVGQLVPKKNIEGLINAWCDMPLRFHRETVLLIVGDGREKKIVIDKMNEFNNIKLFGRVKYEDLPGILGAADVFIHPALLDQWALVVNEAMAAGLPVIVSRYAGASEIVKENGFLFDPGNKNDLKEKLYWCLDNMEKLNIMGGKSRELIRVCL